VRWMNCSRGVLRRTVHAAVCLSTAVPGHVAWSTPLVPDDLVHLRTIESIAVSPTGSHAVCVVNGAEWSTDRSAWSDASQLVLLDLIREDGPAIPLTSGVRQDCAPSFSPDGERIAFLRAAGDAGLQVHVQSIAGGEPKRLSMLSGGAIADDGVAWSADGRWLAVTGRRPVSPMHSAAANPRIDRPDDGSGFAGESVIGTVVCLLDANDPQAEIRRIATSSTRQGIFDPDGESLLCAWMLPDESAPGERNRSVIARVRLDGTAEPDVLLSDPAWDLLSPRLAPDGTAIAVRGRSRNGMLEPDRLGVAALSNRPYRLHWLTGDDVMDRAMLDFQWRWATNRLLLTAPSEGGVTLYTFSRTLLTAPRVLVESTYELPIGVGAFGSGGGVVAYVRTSVDAPSELWLLDGSGDRRRWNPNQWLSERALVLPEAGWATPKGEQPIPWWLFTPRDRAGDDVPLIVLFPPGPGSMWGPGVLDCWFRTQWLVGQGWAVMYANLRGSAGDGRAERRRAFRDPTRGPSRDMLWCIESIQQTHPDIGRTGRALIASSVGTLAAGWSVVAGSFDGAVFEDGVFNVPITLARAEDWSVLIDLFGGPPQDSVARGAMMDSDLVQHIDRIDTPVLLITMGQDPVAEVDSDLFYRLLAMSHKPVERIRYRHHAGGPTIVQDVDVANRIMAFLRARLETPSQTP
jgi:dipeptidyl aminopeptidase/acylaminoacyl peptidase